MKLVLGQGGEISSNFFPLVCRSAANANRPLCGHGRIYDTQLTSSTARRATNEAPSFPLFPVTMKTLLSLISFLSIFSLAMHAAENDPNRMVTDSSGKTIPRSEIKSFSQVAKKFDVRFEPAVAKRGEIVTLKITIQPIESFWTYPTFQPEAATNPNVSFNKLVFPDPGEVIFFGEFKDPSGAKQKSIPELKIKELRYFPGPTEVTFERKAVVSEDAIPGEKSFVLRGLVLNPKTDEAEVSTSNFQICDNGNCFYSDRKSITAKLTILEENVPVDESIKREIKTELSLAAIRKSKVPKKVEPAPKDPPVPRAVSSEVRPLRIPPDRNYQESIDSVLAQLPPPEVTNTGFITFLITAMFWGAVTLMTPCVFPMIPITVSFFIKQGEKKLHNPVVMASVYALTIVLVLGISSVTLLSIFRTLSVNPFMNVALGLLFVFFAMSLFGMFDIQLPGFLAKYTSSNEGQGGYLGTIFMACSFTIVSFTCVAPFLGGFSGMAASGNFSFFQLAMGGLVFAATFAAPFFLLALFPSLLKRMPKSGAWMNTVKVVMGFLELAAALKFFRTAELRWTIPPAIFSYDMVLSMWIALLIFCGLYLLNVYRLPHDYPQDTIGVPRMMFGLMTFTLAFYFLPALFSNGPDGIKQRPGGMVYAWVDAFLLPEPSTGKFVNPGNGELVWSSDLHRAIEDARDKGDLVFLDFTGVTCTNCKLNEQNVFSKEEFKSLLRKFRLVQIYTDTIPPELYEQPPDLGQRDDDAKLTNLEFQRKAFATEQLPLYVILKPTKEKKIDRIGVYREGLINNQSEFAEFLKKPFLEMGK